MPRSCLADTIDEPYASNSRCAQLCSATSAKRQSPGDRFSAMSPAEVTKNDDDKTKDVFLSTFLLVHPSKPTRPRLLIYFILCIFGFFCRWYDRTNLAQFIISPSKVRRSLVGH
jgi:hypothetical protein